MRAAMPSALVTSGARRVGMLAVALLAAAVLTARTGAAPQSPTATITIDGGTAEGRISPLLYGQFIEFMYEGIKRGLHAELIRNRSFEERSGKDGFSRDWNRYPDDRNHDYGMSTAWDERVAYPATEPSEALLAGHSLRVELTPAVIARHGVYQGRVPVRRGVDYRGSLWIRTESFTGGIALALEQDETGGAVYAEAPLAAVGGDWRQYAFTLRPTMDDRLARFAILFTGSGKVWIDQVSLIPADAVDGVRADVLHKAKALAPAFVRWPGGNVAQDYRWQWGIGPRDERPTWINLSWLNEPEPSDFGTDEFIRFARTVGAEPSITVNVEGRGATAEEAAAWVEYCNGPATSRYGMLRARNGHPEPYGVKYWEIGNEIWGDWVRGHSDAATYARNLARYIVAMRAVDPSITVIAVGDNDMEWNRTVARATERFDYLAVHHYYSQRDMDGDLRNLVARPLHYERWYGQLGTMLREVTPGHEPQLAINEWGLDLPESRQYSILGALYAARLMNVFERRSDLIGMSAVSDLVNGWPGGIIQASSDRIFVTPIYLVNKLYATRLGAERLPSTVEGPSVSTTREGQAVPVLDAVASRSADGRTLFIKAVNTDLERSLSVRITISHARVARNATLERVTADSVAAVNGFSTPDAVRSTRESIKVRNSFSFELPRHSVAVLTLTVAK
jgi:alpha-L-arabinofuranosidase